MARALAEVPEEEEELVVGHAEVANVESDPVPVPLVFVLYARKWYVVPHVSPVAVSEYEPVVYEPVASSTSDIVYVLSVPMSKPLSVLFSPPVSVMLPVRTAVVVVIDEAEVVEVVGVEMGGVNETRKISVELFVSPKTIFVASEAKNMRELSDEISVV